MRNQPQVRNAPYQSNALPVFSVMTDRHQTAITALVTAFREEKPVSILVGDGKIETSHVIGAFESNIPEDVTFVRLKHPHADALTAMQHINRAIGFEPNNLCLSDLRNVLVMFLQYQRQHQRRTVLCVEQADEQALWLLDTISSLFSTEALRDSGLLVILTGGPRLSDAPDNSPLGNMRSFAGDVTRLAPFTIQETREFVRQRIELTGEIDVSRVFDFDAVDRLHRLSGGKSDAVAKLCHESLLLADMNGSRPVSAKTVTKAARGLHQESAAELTMTVVHTNRIGEFFDSDELLIIRDPDGTVSEFPLSVGRFMIGRTESADIVLPCLKVSRRHALLIRTAEHVQILDLGSSNGTHLNGHPVKEQILGPGDLIKIGECEVQYLVKD